MNACMARSRAKLLACARTTGRSLVGGVITAPPKHSALLPTGQLLMTGGYGSLGNRAWVDAPATAPSPRGSAAARSSAAATPADAAAEAAARAASLAASASAWRHRRRRRRRVSRSLLAGLLRALGVVVQLA